MAQLGEAGSEACAKGTTVGNHPIIDIRGLTLSTDPIEPEGNRACADRVTLLENINLQIFPGETVLITGHSGSGKTSLLRVLNGLIPHIIPGNITGFVEVAGQVPWKVELPEAGSVSASVFQNPRTQFFATDVLSELSFAPANRNVPREEILERVAQVAPAMGVASMLDCRMDELSGGECQLVAIASAVVGQPKVYLLDEPTANLDDRSTQQVSEAIAELRRRGATILIAEHRLHHLHGLVDRVVEMRGGRVLRDMPAQEFWSLDQQARVAAGLRCFDMPSSVHVPEVPRVKTRENSHHRFTEGLVLGDFDVPGLRNEGALQFPRGAITCITGDNGAGKTTLVRSIVGLCKPMGTVELDGEVLSIRERRKRSFAVMQDVNRQLFASSLVDEMLLSVGHRSSVNAEEIEMVLASLGLGEMGERHPLSLSGGQRQRLAVATAKVAGADVIAFDEPTCGLDHTAMTHMGRVIRDCAEDGAVVLVVTHDRELIEEIADFELRMPSGEAAWSM